MQLHGCGLPFRKPPLIKTELRLEGFGCCWLDESKPVWKHPCMEIAIVGASLTGLTSALACASRGIRTTILERGHGQHQSGSALGVDRALLQRVVGIAPHANRDDPPFPVITGYRNALSWQAIHGWLRELALRRPEITILLGTSVRETVQSPTHATAITADGRRIDAAAIVGADGYRSVVRKAVNPDQPHGLYAGYLLWRGLVSEANLPPDTPWPQNNNGVALATQTGYRLVAYPVANLSGSLVPGERMISFAWYDPGRANLLRERRCLSASREVLASLGSKQVPRAMLDELRTLAVSMWPNPWQAAVTCAIKQREIFATPVAEYLPKRLVNGRLVVIGDAAHVASPVIGRGFTAGVLDADLLAKSIAPSNTRDSAEISRALADFERNRLPEAQSLVETSMTWSRGFVAGEEFSLWKGWKRNLRNKS